MIDFGLTADEAMVVELATEFGADQLRPQSRSREAACAIDDALRTAFSETGLDLLAADHPDAAEVSLPARMAAIEALAHADAGATLALWFGALSNAWGERLGAGSVGFVHLVDGLRTGVCPCLPLGGATRILLMEPSGGWWVVAVEPEPQAALGLQAASPASIQITEPTAEGRAEPSQRDRLLAEIRLFAAAALTGIARAARDHAEAYVQERVAFDKRLADHQGVAFLIADVAMGVEGASLLGMQAAAELEEGRAERAADAYLEAVETALLATSTGVQLLGGHGFMKDHPVEKWMRDARALSLLWGGADSATRDASGGLP